jgi:hypothetical protein
MSSTIRIWFENLSASRHDGLHALNSLMEEDHIHGGLRIEIGGRLAPCLGYFGADDVCLDVWVGELSEAAKILESPHGKHSFDEGEQGQPAFVFEREGEHAHFSITDSMISDGLGLPDWQRVSFQPDDFTTAHDAFRRALWKEIEAKSGAEGRAWAIRVGLISKPDM